MPSGSPPLAKSRLRRQRSTRLSRFAPGPGTAAQENESLLQHQRQRPGRYRTSDSSQPVLEKRSGEKPAAIDESLTVEVRSCIPRLYTWFRMASWVHLPVEC